MIIRRANENDIDGVLELLGQVLYVHHVIKPDLFMAEGSKHTRESLLEMFADDKNPIFVAVDDDGKVLGHCFTQIKDLNDSNHVPQKVLHIDDLCVHKDARGKHVGKALHDFVMGFAKELGCSRVTLHVWEGNDAAKAFYDAMGFSTYMMGMEIKL